MPVHIELPNRIKIAIIVASWGVIAGMILWANCTRADVVESIHRKSDGNLEAIERVERIQERQLEELKGLKIEINEIERR